MVGIVILMCIGMCVVLLAGAAGVIAAGASVLPVFIEAFITYWAIRWLYYELKKSFKK